jgi:hypothetical protein
MREPTAEDTVPLLLFTGACLASTSPEKIAIYRNTVERERDRERKSERERERDK